MPQSPPPITCQVPPGLLPGLAVARNPKRATQQQVMPDDHSESVPPLPIPNRTVKRLHADDSADTRVKVGNRQASYVGNNTPSPLQAGGFVLSGSRPISERDCQQGARVLLDIA